MSVCECYSEKLSDDPSSFDDISDAIEEAAVAQTRARVAAGRQETQNRVRPHLEKMCAYLDTFESAADIS